MIKFRTMQCDHEAIEGTLQLESKNQSGTIDRWPFFVEAIAYQLLCIGGFAGNVLVLHVLRSPTTKHCSIGSLLYRLVAITILISLPLLAVRNVFMNSDTVYQLPLNSCFCREASDLLGDLLMLFEIILLALFLLLVADRYVSVFKPFRRTVLCHRPASLYKILAIVIITLAILTAYDIYTKFFKLLSGLVLDSKSNSVSSQNRSQEVLLNFTMKNNLFSNQNITYELNQSHFWANTNTPFSENSLTINMEPNFTLQRRSYTENQLMNLASQLIELLVTLTPMTIVGISFIVYAVYKYILCIT